MKKAIYLTALLMGTLSLSGCYFAPGMHMKTQDLTPTPSRQAIVTPKIVPITAKLVLQLNEEAKLEQEKAAKAFVDPKDFFTDTNRYHYEIGPQDVLTITVWDHPELNNPGNAAISKGGSGFTVDDNGNIYFPYAGFIHVADKTVDQIRTLIAGKLALFIKQPQVSVQIAAYNSQHIQVYGAVKQVKMLPINNIPLTVREAITLVGGVNRCGPSTSSGGSSSGSNGGGICADMQNVILERDDKKISINLSTLTAPNGHSENYILQGGDSIYVPDNNHSRVFILGAVTRPGPYNIGSEPMTLREAFGDAAGVTFSSDPTYTYVIRNYQHNPQVFELDARSPDALNLAGDFMLKPQDIVFVSTSKLTDFNSVINQLTPTLATYAYIHSIAR